MARIKKKYNFTNSREIWRLIPTTTGKLIIEERDLTRKEAFYNCIEIDSGKKIFSDFQLEEKYWTCIESVEEDIILFHKYIKPDMPMHKGIIAFDIASQKIIWSNDDYNFLFAGEQKIYCYKPLFEGRNYYSVGLNSGEIIEDLGSDHKSINLLKEKLSNNNANEVYLFPESFSQTPDLNPKAEGILKRIRSEYVLVGKIDYILFNSILLMNFHEAAGDNLLNNRFKVIDIESGKNIFEETLNKKITAFIPDSFFMINDKLLLLKDKNEVIVCSIK
jgi:hypothetical protein